MTSPIPFRLRDIDHVVIRTRNLAAIERFYRDVLGCSEERRQEKIGLIQLRAGRSLIDIVPVDSELGRVGGPPPSEAGRNMDHLCLRIEPFDVDAIRAHLARHGVEVGPPTMRYGAEGEGLSMYVQDPDGNTVELKGPPAT